MGKVLNWAARLPAVGPLFAVSYSEMQVAATIIPVNSVVRSGTPYVISLDLIEALLARAAHRVAVTECLCRASGRCRAFPADLGCLFLGEGAREIAPSLGRAVSVREGMDHAERAVRLGLAPMILHSALDAWIMGIRGYRRMLAVCFCCDCCCTVRDTMAHGAVSFLDRVQRLPGLQVIVNDKCTGCGRCEAVCPAKAIRVLGGRAQIADRCKGCGRCALECPQEAVAMRLAPGTDVVAALMARVGERTAIGASGV